MSTTRTAYHVILYRLLKARGPRNFTFQFEQPLTVDLQRADLILVRKTDGSDQSSADGDVPILPGLWPQLPGEAIAEYKSPSGGVRPGDLARLVGYAGQYHSQNVGRLGSSHDLALAFLVSSWTPSLEMELARFRWTVRPLGAGYYATNAGPYPLYVVLIDEVAQAERDVLLDVVGHRTMESDEADRWLASNAFTSPEEPDMDKLEGYDELMAKVVARLPAALRLKGIPVRERLEGIPARERLAGIPAQEWLAGIPAQERLAGLPPEERLAGLPPEERLAGLPPEEQVLALSNEVLATFPESYVQTLPENVRDEIRRRLSH